MTNNNNKIQNLKKDKNGKYSFTVTKTHPVTGKVVQRRRGGFKTKENAYHAYLQVEEKLKMEFQ